MFVLFVKIKHSKKDGKLRKVESNDRKDKGRKVFPMSPILQIYISHLPDHLPKKYPVTKLQDKLERYYNKAIIVQPQCGQGKSNFVFRSNVSIGNVVAAARKLTSKLKTSKIEQDVLQVSNNISNDQILIIPIPDGGGFWFRKVLILTRKP